MGGRVIFFFVFAWCWGLGVAEIEEFLGLNLSVWEMGGEIVFIGRKWVSWFGRVFGGGDF